MNTIFTHPQTVIAHRGASAFAPENTMAAFELAIAQGARWIEFDMMLTQDEEMIVHHDLDFTRILGHRGLVAATQYASIATLDAGSWLDTRFRQETIPRLADVLGYMNTAGVNINIELKPAPGTEEKTAQCLLKLLDDYGLNVSVKIILSSFSPICLNALAKHNQTASQPKALAFLTTIITPQTLQEAKHYGCIGIHADESELNKKDIPAVKNAGFYLAYYTVNNAKKAQRLFAAGVDAIFSDYPQLLVASS